MKTNYIYSIVIAFFGVIVVSGNGVAQSPDATSGSPTLQAGNAGEESIPMDLRSVMENNMKEMLKIEMSGQVDEDFAKMLAQHHQGGIKMAEVYLKSAQDSRLREMAERTMKQQKKEIIKLEAFVTEHNVESKNPEASKQLMEPIKKKSEGDKSLGTPGGIDEQFATLMIDHHKTGVDLAQVEVNKGTHPAMKEMARKVKKEQTKEIEELQSWLSARRKR